MPYYINRDSLLEHALVRGGSGAGKTALILAPLTEQLIRQAGRKDDSSVLILDLKGDPALFHGTRLAAQAAGLPFRWFTLESGRSSFAMNPFLQKNFKTSLSRSQAAP